MSKEITEEEKSKRKRDREISDLRFILKSVEGRRVYWRLLSKTGLFLDSFVQGDNGYSTTYNSGRRGVGLWALKELMDAKPEAFIQMQNESASEMKRQEREVKEEIKDKNILKTGD